MLVGCGCGTVEVRNHLMKAGKMIYVDGKTLRLKKLALGK